MVKRSIQAYVRALRRRGCKPEYADQIEHRLTQLLRSGGNLQRAATLVDFLDAGLDAGWAPGTATAYRDTITGFLRWMGLKVPLALRRFRVPAEAARPRRALSPAEFGRLLSAAETAPRGKFSMTGRQRAGLYRIAAVTGLRAGELRLITPQDIDRPGSALWVHPKGQRLPRRVPVHSSVLQAIDAIWAPVFMEVDAQVFRIPKNPTRMLQRDLAAAQVPFSTPDGRFDFHALRYQLARDLIRAGYQPPEVMAIMRHRTFKLTTDLYARLGASDVSQLLARMPHWMTGDKHGHVEHDTQHPRA